MKVLVTGGNGFIGTAVARELETRGHEPVIFDRHRDNRLQAALDAIADKKITMLPGRDVILGDVRDATAVTEAVAHVDAVIHLAGVLGTAETISNPKPAAEINVLGGLNVLEACAQYKTRLVNIAVGNHFETSTYSITKSTVERFVTMYAKYRGLPACNVRAYNVYGPGQSVAQPYGTSRVRKIIPSFIVRALHGEPIQVYGSGDQVMDMIYITDAAKCLVTALEKNDSALYHAGTARRTTVNDIAKAVAVEVQNQTGSPVPIEYLPMRPGETPGVEVIAHPSLVQPLGNPEDFVLLQDGLVRTVSYYRQLFAK